MNALEPNSPLKIGILLLPPCSLFEIAAITEPLSRINRLSGRRQCDYFTISTDGEAVQLHGGNVWNVDFSIKNSPLVDILFVLAEDISISRNDHLITSFIGQIAKQEKILCGIHLGSWWLAKAGVLDQCRATIHWTEQERFCEEFNKIIVTSSLYEIDNQRMTCAGGSCSLDLLLHLIHIQFSSELAGKVAEQLCIERIRDKNEKQRIPLQNIIGPTQPKLTEAVMLMEANLEEPLTTLDIATYVGLSKRQLERLFKQYLNCVPSKYYLDLRLNRARHLLLTTSKSIVQIGLICGFSSGPHFSSAYKMNFGITPRDERQVRFISSPQI
ncbi:GlxA family transcriptional regulator [Leeia sp. TBRC 13508]|uniref:GlxA family transcriptional regulator n=1 Tax=Leeia speluncae TaxID=2884804 RepID=A0ABS8DB20_9NEIS|nr:GlxA family transcriptional regulator [Leeia speluncae]MCB6185111.1 GlxA family transcriptional regulator [Leeia speluncae]